MPESETPRLCCSKTVWTASPAIRQWGNAILKRNISFTTYARNAPSEDSWRFSALHSSPPRLNTAGNTPVSSTRVPVAIILPHLLENKDLQNRLCAERTQSGNRGLSIGLVLLFPFLRARLNDEIKRKRCANFMEYKKLQPLPTVSWNSLAWQFNRFGPLQFLLCKVAFHSAHSCCFRWNMSCHLPLNKSGSLHFQVKAATAKSGPATCFSTSVQPALRRLEERTKIQAPLLKPYVPGPNIRRTSNGADWELVSFRILKMAASWQKKSIQTRQSTKASAHRASRRCSPLLADNEESLALGPKDMLLDNQNPFRRQHGNRR